MTYWWFRVTNPQELWPGFQGDLFSSTEWVQRVALYVYMWTGVAAMRFTAPERGDRRACFKLERQVIWLPMGAHPSGRWCVTHAVWETRRPQRCWL